MKPSDVSLDRPFFPMLLSLAGKKCVVVGAGKVATAKIQGLSLCEADVIVVSPRAVPAIQRQARAGALIWRRRNFAARDLDGAFLAVAATNSSRTNAAVFRACASRAVLCNSVDDPEHCNFIYPAVVRRGPLLIAISTEGRSPALAARLRRELEQQFGPEWGAWVEYLGLLRDELRHSDMRETTRRQRLQKMVTPRAFHAFLRERKKKPSQKKRRRSA